MNAREVTNGTLDLKLGYKVKDNLLLGENSIVLSDFELGDKVVFTVQRGSETQEVPEGPALITANRSGAGDAAALSAALDRPALFCGDRAIADAPSLVQFLLNPLVIPAEEAADWLRRGFDVIAFADSPAGETAARSRFRLEPLDAASRAEAPAVPVWLSGAERYPFGRRAKLSFRQPENILFDFGFW